MKRRIEEKDDLSAKKTCQTVEKNLNPLHEAVIRNDLNFMESYKGHDIDFVDIDGLTPMHYAAKLNRVQMAQILWQKGAHINKKDHAGLSPANYAARYGEFMVFFLDKGVDILKVEEKSKSLLESIAEYQNYSMVGYLIETFGRLKVKDTNNLSILYYAYRLPRNIGFFRKLVERCDGFDDTDFKTNSDCMNFLISTNCEEKFSILLDKGQNTHLEDEEGHTFLHYAVKKGYLAYVKMLLEKKADPHKEDRGNYSSIHISVIYNRIEIFNLFAKEVENLGKKNLKGQNILHLAVINKLGEIIKIILNGQNSKFFKNCEVNERDSAGRTPLHYAVLADYDEGVEILLKHGADANIEDNLFFITPFNLAIIYFRKKSAEILFKEVKNFPTRNSKGSNLLHFAVIRNNEKTMDYILGPRVRKIFDLPTVDERDNKNETPLHHAVRQGAFNCVRVLLRFGADVNAINGNRMNNLHLAAGNRVIEITEILIAKNVDKNARDNNFVTPLHVGVSKNNVPYVSALLKAGGINFSAEDSDGNTPLKLAQKMGHERISCLISGEMLKESLGGSSIRTKSNTVASKNSR